MAAGRATPRRIVSVAHSNCVALNRRLAHEMTRVGGEEWEITVKHTEVPGYLNAMDVLCAPSQTIPTWREQQGRMLIEAFASGLPVVASDSGEIPHVVADAGIVVGEADTDGWVDALGTLLESTRQRDELAERGRDRAETAFAWPVIAQRHLDFFTEVIEGRA